jgi:hypothetical protein
VARSARGSIALRIGFRQALAKRFFETLDAAAQSEGKMAWVEKTPSHLHSIGAIERYVPEAKFIHMLRSGEAAIASLFNVTQKHPDRWGGARSLDRCIGRWQQDVRCSHACVGLPNHCFVSYERLVEDPAAVLGRLVGWMGLPGEEGVIALMLSGYREQLARVAVKEPWKDGVGGDIANRNDARINELLSAAEQADLTRALAPERRLLSDLPFLSLPG